MWLKIYRKTICFHRNKNGWRGDHNVCGQRIKHLLDTWNYNLRGQVIRYEVSLYFSREEYCLNITQSTCYVFFNTHAAIQKAERPLAQSDTLVRSYCAKRSKIICVLGIWFSAVGWTVGAVWRETVTYGCVRDWGGSSLGLLDWKCKYQSLEILVISLLNRGKSFFGGLPFWLWEEIMQYM